MDENIMINNCAKRKMTKEIKTNEKKFKLTKNYVKGDIVSMDRLEEIKMDIESGKFVARGSNMIVWTDI